MVKGKCSKCERPAVMRVSGDGRAFTRYCGEHAPADLAGVPVRSSDLTTVRAIGGFVQTSERFVGRGF